ncbi:NPC intracellular cholesterol transporter 2-like [Liolophura sinensis]|uniref:NPC intracellular cholesterol transporter 2-like n=1 Tax=Liolophura sinensis TaxID=3198878 RepID=UPI0031587335
MGSVQAIWAFLSLVCIVHAFSGLPKYFKDCGSEKGAILSVSVSGCSETDDQCELKKGTTIHVAIQFKSSEVITNATAVVHGILAGIPVPFPIDQPDGCKSGFTCPVKEGEEVTYKSDIAVSKNYPSVKVVVKWELKDQNSKDIFCALFKSEIIS